MKKFYFVVIVLAILQTGCGDSVNVMNTGGTTSPATIPDYDFSTVDKLLSTSIAVFNGQVYVALKRDDSVMYEFSAGGVDNNTVFDIASATKWISSAVILMLAEQGYFSLDDPVGDYLPIFNSQGKGYFTIRHAFSMSSGLFDTTRPQQYKGGFDFDLTSPIKMSFKTQDFSPVMFSVEALTSVVELMAAKEFIHKKNMDKGEVARYDGHLKKLRKEYIPFNLETLGGYRPEEHIDNPLELGQDDDGGNRGDKTLYSGFVGFVPDDHALHQINKTFGMKNYIRSPDSYQVEDAAYPTAYEYIMAQLKKSGKEGGISEADCLINFGAAMHTLEDYFAHTNFSEISLMKSVEPYVFPWVDEVKLRYFDIRVVKRFGSRAEV